MSKSAKSSKKLAVTPIIVAILCGAIVVLGIVEYRHAKLRDRVGLMQFSYTYNDIKSDYQIRRLEFCLKNSIKDCNNETLYKWNDEHPKNAFPVRSSMQALIDENSNEKGETTPRIPVDPENKEL